MAATFELSMHVEAVSRSEAGGNRSATAAAAYRACCVIECERTGITHDYRRKQGHEATETIIPLKTGKWAKQPGALWNAAEMAERNGKRGKNAGEFKANARTARDCMFSFPHVLSEAGRLNVARVIARHVVEAHGIGAMFSIHKPGRKGDDRNFHCHMMMTTRRVTANGLGAKAREWDDRSGPKVITELRAFIAATINAELAAEGKADLVFVEHRSFKARGMTQKPQTHQGPARMHAQRKQQIKDRNEWFRQEQAQQRDRHGKEFASMRVRQDFGLQTKLADIAQRQGTGEAAIRRELDRQREADKVQRRDGIRAAFRALTGRAGREAFEQQTREGQRVHEATQQIAALKKELGREERTYTAGQVQDRTQLIERQQAEDRQLQQALASRESLDQTKDRQLQREQRRERTQEQDHTQQQERTQPRGRTRGGPEFTL